MVVLSIEIVAGFCCFYALLDVRRGSGLVPVGCGRLLGSLRVNSSRFGIFVYFLYDALILCPLLFIDLPFLESVSVCRRLLFMSKYSIVCANLKVLFSTPTVGCPKVFCLPVLMLKYVDIIFCVGGILRSSSSVLVVLLVLLVSACSYLFIKKVVTIMIGAGGSGGSGPVPGGRVSRWCFSF